MEAGSAKQHRSRRGVVYGLIAFASLLAFVAAFAVWANRQLLETDTWVETSTELLEDTEIREALANFMVDELYANVDVQAELQQGLPPQLAPLAGPAAAGLRQLTDTAANEALQRPRVQALWEELNREAHGKLIEVVEEDSGEPVTLDLGQIVTDLGEQNGIDVANKVPPDAGQIEVLPADKLSAAQDVIKLLKGVAIVLTLLALILFALALYLARGWRREALRAIGFGVLLVGIAVLFVRGLAGNAVVGSLASSESVEPAVEDTWEIGTSLLAAGGGALLFYGIVILIGSWLAGPGHLARGARRAITPVLERRPIAYAALALVLLLLFWWSPTPGFERLPTSILIIALMVIGMEALRAQAIKDFPDETWEGATERWGAGARSRLGRGRSGGG
jgi:hypothetical protein